MNRFFIKYTTSLLKLKALVLLVVIGYFSIGSAQTVLELRPNGSKGIDALISSLSPNDNFADHPDFTGIAWTVNGAPITARGLIKFDMSDIPVGATIISAKLSLYSYTSPYNLTHSNRSGPNESVLQRVTSAWEESKVTWNNQPTVDLENQIILKTTTQDIQSYENIDVTALVEGMIENPKSNFGFRLKLVTEGIYRRMLFASSDVDLPALHPKLVVTFTTNKASSNCKIRIYPNPTFGLTNISLDNCSEFKNLEVELFDMQGKFVRKYNNAIKTSQIDVSDLIRGVYLVRLSNNNKTISFSKLLKP